MPSSLRIRRGVGTWLTRAIALTWAAWCAATAYAYIDGAPTQLQRLENIIHIDVWVFWAIAATVLTLGSLVPPRAGQVSQEIAGWLRGGGLAITAGLLGIWALEFFLTDATRGWVSAKNYALLAACAIFHCWWVGRNVSAHGLD